MSLRSHSSSGGTTASSSPGMSGIASDAMAWSCGARPGSSAQETMRTPSGGSTGGGSRPASGSATTELAGRLREARAARPSRASRAPSPSVPIQSVAAQRSSPPAPRPAPGPRRSSAAPRPARRSRACARARRRAPSPAASPARGQAKAPPGDAAVLHPQHEGAGVLRPPGPLLLRRGRERRPDLVPELDPARVVGRDVGQRHRASSSTTSPGTMPQAAARLDPLIGDADPAGRVVVDDHVAVAHVAERARAPGQEAARAGLQLHLAAERHADGAEVVRPRAERHVAEAVDHEHARRQHAVARLRRRHLEADEVGRIELRADGLGLQAGRQVRRHRGEHVAAVEGGGHRLQEQLLAP